MFLFFNVVLEMDSRKRKLDKKDEASSDGNAKKSPTTLAFDESGITWCKVCDKIFITKLVSIRHQHLAYYCQLIPQKNCTL